MSLRYVFNLEHRPLVEEMLHHVCYFLMLELLFICLINGGVCLQLKVSKFGHEHPKG